MLEVWQTDMKLVESSVGLPPMRETQGLFRVLKRVSLGAHKKELVRIFKVNLVLNVSMSRLISEDQEEPDQGKSQWRQDESNQCHSEDAMKALQEQVGENVTSCRSKPMTIVHRTSHRGQLIK
ncbi:hypothetical protein J1N35_043402 [Gossypium stocksii]|uniref:Uncharacterized protein n=1 Tax=Gossypium stocksii TaxID=47602 RepID=A0A9D3U7D7_9ROSI|nr:hypothetical protein J1N35_043402 [Gossypium stocksii]